MTDVLLALAELRAKAEAATPGPWIVWNGPEYEGGGADLCIGAGETWLANMDHRINGQNPFGFPGWAQVSECDIASTSDEQAANAAFIAAADPTTLLALVDEVERLRARVAELEEQVSWGCEEGCGDCAGCEAGYAAAVARVRRE